MVFMTPASEPGERSAGKSIVVISYFPGVCANMKNPHNLNVDSTPANPLFIKVLPARAQARRGALSRYRIGEARSMMIREGVQRRGGDTHGSVPHRLQGLNLLGCHRKRPNSRALRKVERFWVNCSFSTSALPLFPCAMAGTFYP